MEFLRKLGQYAEFTSRYSASIGLVCMIMTLLLIATDGYNGVLSSLSGKAAKSIGKALGKIGEVLVFITISYYALREGYVQAKRRKVVLPSLLEEGLTAVIRMTRHIHPLSGSVVLCLIILHGYVLALVWPSAKYGAIWSGILALGLLAIVSILGWRLRMSHPALALRKGHRYTGLLFVGLYVLHKVLAD